MRRDPAKTGLLAQLIAAMAVFMMFAIPQAMASNSDTTCRVSHETLERLFATSGMLVDTDTMVTVIQDVGADQTERHLSLIVLACSGDQSMATIFLKALSDSNYVVRTGAITGMRYLWIPESIPLLTEIVRDQSELDTVRQMTAGILSVTAVDDPEVALAIGEAARDQSQNHNVRLNYVFSLGRLRSVAATEQLLGLLDDSDNADMRATTAVALAQHQLIESVPHLVEAVLSPYTQFWLKSKAARHLERLVGEDFGFTTTNGFPEDGEIERSHAEIYDWWQENQDKYQAPQ